MSNPAELYIWHRYPDEKPPFNGWYIVALDEHAYSEISYEYYDKTDDWWNCDYELHFSKEKPTVVTHQTKLDYPTVYAWGFTPNKPHFKETDGQD